MPPAFHKRLIRTKPSKANAGLSRNVDIALALRSECAKLSLSTRLVDQYVQLRSYA